MKWGTEVGYTHVRTLEIYLCNALSPRWSGVIVPTAIWGELAKKIKLMSNIGKLRQIFPPPVFHPLSTQGPLAHSLVYLTVIYLAKVVYSIKSAERYVRTIDTFRLCFVAIALLH